MPASDYTSTVSGGLKLKGGAKDAGVKKKSKKSKSSKEKAAKSTEIEEAAGDSKNTGTALASLSEKEQPSERDLTPSEQQPSSSISDFGKTEAQRRHEEIKRKRVRLHTQYPIPQALSSQNN